MDNRMIIAKDRHIYIPYAKVMYYEIEETTWEELVPALDRYVEFTGAKLNLYLADDSWVTVKKVYTKDHSTQDAVQYLKNEMVNLMLFFGDLDKQLRTFDFECLTECVEKPKEVKHETKELSFER